MAAQDDAAESGQSADAAAIAAAWAEGEAGWARLARDWGLGADAAGDQAGPTDPSPAEAGRWWAGPPWNGRIAADEFRAIVAAYVARYGAYTPDLPCREPGLLRAWLRERQDPETRPPRVAA